MVAAILLSLSVIGVLLREPKTFPKISILKPLCGNEPGLEESIRAFADLDYPNYELILGVRDIAWHFEGENVGLVTHPIVGASGAGTGSVLDMLHLTTSIAPGIIGSKRFLKRDIVVGKSMAMKKRDLHELGGFEAMKNILAEDFVLGEMVGEHKRIALSRMTVENRPTLRTARQFFKRYQRWSVIHHQAVGFPLYMAEILLNPTALCALALVADARVPDALLVFFAKLACDALCARALTGRFLSLSAMLLIPAKDAVLFFAWLYGLLFDSVDWRGNKLRVLAGTRLASPDSNEAAEVA